MSNNYDPIDTCPYDPVHRIMRSRMQYHLTKCAKNWPCSKKKQCPYNACHVVNQIEFNYHVSICQQRESMWHYKEEKEEEKEDPGILPIDPSPTVAPAEDIWEEEGNIQSYDPIKYTENRLITRILIGAPKSQRKKHRLQERLRISRLQDNAPKKEKDQPTQSNNKQHAPSTVKPSIPEEESVKAKRIYEPLRPPKELPTDTSKSLKIDPMNDSTVVLQMQTSINQNEPLQYVQEKTNSNEDLEIQRKMFSYAAAAKNVFIDQRQRYSSVESDYDFIESKLCDTEKENSNSSFLNRNKEDLKLQPMVSYAAAAKNVLTNQHQQYSIIESDYDVIESKKYDTEKENYNSIFNRNTAFDLQATTFSYAAAAKNALPHQQYSYTESDYAFIESKNWDNEKENSNSSFSNRSKDVDLPTTISYAAAAKIVPTHQRLQNSSIESIKVDTKKDNNSLLTNKNKEILDQQRTFNYATAAKYVPPHQRHQNSNIESDSDVVTESIKCETGKENNSSFFNTNKEDLDMQTTFNYTSADENVPTIRRPRNSSIESDCDIIISESIKCDTEKENSSSFFNRNKENWELQSTTLNYAAEAENVPIVRRPRNSSIESDCDINENIKCDIEKNNNSSFVNRNKEDSNLQATTFNYAAARKYVPLNQRHRNNSIQSDYDLQSTKFSYSTATKNLLTNQPERYSSIESDYDMHTATLFRYATAAKNALTNRRPSTDSIESDYDMVIESINYNTEKEYNSAFFNNTVDENLVKVTKTVKALSIADDGHKDQTESLDRTLESLQRTVNYSSITSNGINRININKPLTSEKRPLKCSANLHFTNLRQYLQNTK